MSEQGTALRRLREDQGLTQVELAVRLNVSRFTVGDWEKGKVAWPEKREQYILEACGIGRDRFFQDIAEGVSYEVARQGAAIRLGPRWRASPRRATHSTPSCDG